MPRRRMKTNRQPRVPLCGRASMILKEAEALGERDGPLAFTGEQRKPLDDKQLRRMVRELENAAVPHGFRSGFRDWADREAGDADGKRFEKVVLRHAEEIPSWEIFKCWDYEE